MLQRRGAAAARCWRLLLYSPSSQQQSSPLVAVTSVSLSQPVRYRCDRTICLCTGVEPRRVPVFVCCCLAGLPPLQRRRRPSNTNTTRRPLIRARIRTRTSRRRRQRQRRRARPTTTHLQLNATVASAILPTRRTHHNGDLSHPLSHFHKFVRKPLSSSPPATTTPPLPPQKTWRSSCRS